MVILGTVGKACGNSNRFMQNTGKRQKGNPAAMGLPQSADSPAGKGVFCLGSENRTLGGA